GRRIAIDYFDATGAQLFTRHRPGRNGQRFDQPAGVKLQPYGLWKLGDGHRQGRLIVVEGESDAWALWYNGYPALGLPGSGTFKCLSPEAIETLETVYVCREPDAGGQAFVRGVADRLKQLGFRGRVLTFSCPANLKAPPAFHPQAPTTLKLELETCLASPTPVPCWKNPNHGGPSHGRDDTAAPKRRAFPVVGPYRPFPVKALPGPL